MANDFFGIDDIKNTMRLKAAKKRLNLQAPTNGIQTQDPQSDIATGMLKKVKKFNMGGIQPRFK